MVDKHSYGRWHVESYLVGLDILSWSVSALVVWGYRMLENKFNVSDYVLLFFCMMLGWLLIGWTVGRYRMITNEARFRKRILLLFVSLSVYALVLTLLVTKFTLLAVDVFFYAMLIVGGFELLNDFILFAYRYAQDQGEPLNISDQRVPQQLSVEKRRRDPDDADTIELALTGAIGADATERLKKEIDIDMNTTLFVNSSDIFNLEKIAANRYDTIVNLKQMNTVRGVNKMMCMVNAKLPDNGRFCCRFVNQGVIRSDIMARYPNRINKLVYITYYIYRRILPRLTFTHNLYFDWTGGKKRAFSTTEVLGRLYFCGFSVEKEVKIGRMTYVFARRIKQPEPQYPRRWYGPLIRLPRVGYHYQTIWVYKMRTMHPYSEYLQQYIYEKRGLQEGGKFKNDPRVSKLGHWMRRLWLDELPMVINMLKGEMKLVGVRPLSRQYFGLYPSELQELRTSVKPGLLPPFYVDMPKTEDEIFESERKYLLAYKKHPIWTDVKYLLMIIYTILFKRARSN